MCISFPNCLSDVEKTLQEIRVVMALSPSNLFQILKEIHQHDLMDRNQCLPDFFYRE